MSNNAEGAVPFGFDSKPPAGGPSAVYTSLEGGEEAASDLDPKIEPNKFPREGGSDTYPADGII